MNNFYFRILSNFLGSLHGESTVISMRITKAMLADIDKIAAETGRTRNELMSLGLEFALKHIKIIDK